VNPSSPSAGSPTAHHPGFWEAFRVWVKVGLLSFGGPTGQIALMHTELVDKRRWVSDNRFLHALNYCMLLPGPEAQQLSVYIGWLLHKTAGGIVAGTLFVLPGALLLWIVSFVYMKFGEVPVIAALFYGLKAGVMAIVADAVIRIGRKVLQNEVMWTLAALAFVAIFFFHVWFPVIIVGAGIIGLVGGRLWRAKFLVIGGHDAKPGAAGGAAVSDEHDALEHTRPSWMRSVRVALTCLLLWWAPVALVGVVFGGGSTFCQQGLFFSKAAVVTFGGAYAVLPYVAQNAVEHYQWLSALEMMDGLGLAETTPGPLILVLQFVGFLGGWHQPETLSPALAATLSAALVTWVTFTPAFLFIFLGAPYIEQLRGNVHLTTALSAITAAVVGVVLNLAVWFGWHVVFPEGKPVEWFPLMVALAAFAGMLRFRWDVFWVVAGSGALGLAHHFLTR
jgi:chromate transporter